MHTIYMITNKINGKKYIGYTSKENPYHRYIEHVSAAKGKNYQKQNIHKAIRKYGAENFEFSIIYQNECKDLVFKKMEHQLIIEHNTLGPYGYNMARGGGGSGEISADTRQKMSDAKKGKIPWNKGQKNLSIPWNKGLTKKDPRVAINIEKSHEKRKESDNYVAWNKGKSKDEYPQLSNSGAKKGNIPWNKKT